MDESALLDELRRGNNDAYKQLFITYYSPLCEFASQYISDDDAEELVQELMLYIWETRESIIIESSLKSYLFTATKHRCLNFIKKNQYHEQVHSSIYEKLKDINPSVAEKNLKYVTLQEISEELKDGQTEDEILSRINDNLSQMYEQEMELENYDAISDFFTIE